MKYNQRIAKIYTRLFTEIHEEINVMLMMKDESFVYGDLQSDPELIHTIKEKEWQTIDKAIQDTFKPLKKLFDAMFPTCTECGSILSSRRFVGIAAMTYDTQSTAKAIDEDGIVDILYQLRNQEEQEYGTGEGSNVNVITTIAVTLMVWSDKIGRKIDRKWIHE